MATMRRNKSDLFSTIEPESRAAFISPSRGIKNQSNAFKEAVEYTGRSGTKWTGPISKADSNQQNYDNM
jgi:hypothetical protein